MTAKLVSPAALGEKLIALWKSGGLRWMGEKIEPKNGKPDFNKIRRIYADMMPVIMAAAPHWTDPYFIDWMPLFTPIETQMWFMVRAQHVPFYPQFPVGKYFVDFGNPHHKVAIECDGKAWHANREKDEARDGELFDLGWTVVRFSGHACFKLQRLPDVLSIPPFEGIDAFDPALMEEPEE